MPLIAGGADAGAPHMTWDDTPIAADEGVFFEIAGCYRRYHAPLCRTIYLGAPPAPYLEAEKALLEGIEAGLAAARPGNRAEDNETDQSARISAQVALACRTDFLLSKPGFGGDEGLMIETNEMLRTLALIRAAENT